MLSKHRGLNILNFNANGIIHQTYELQALLVNYDIDLACISETHLKPNIKFRLRNYTVIRTDRNNRPGGGTAIIIKNSMPYRRAILPIFQNLEATGIFIQLEGTEILVASVYHPPYAQLNENDLTLLITRHKHFILCGDLNAKHKTWNSRLNTSKGETLLLHSHKFHYSITGPKTPTRFPWITTHHPDVLDICLCNTKYSPVQQICLNALDSDHIPVLLIFKAPFHMISNQPTTEKVTDWNAFTQRLHQIIPGTLPTLKTSEIDTAIQIFSDTVIDTFDETSSTLAFETTNNVYGSNELKYLLKAKNQARKRWQLYADPQAKRAFYRYQRAIRRKYEIYKINKFADTVENIKPTGKTFWTFTKRMLGKTIAKKSTPIKDSSGTFIYDPIDRLEALANSFQNRFSSHHHSSLQDFSATISQHVQSILHRPETGTAPHVRPQELKTIIRKLAPKKTPGPDKITPAILKKLPKRAITHLTKIFNSCLHQNYFPTAWKTAHIIPIVKPGKDPTLPQSYRPISLTNFLGKIFERIILARLKTYLTAPDVIHHEQFGFKPHHSPREALHRLTTSVQRGFQLGQHTVATFIDIQQAFDTVWHTGLLYKLHNLNIPINYIQLIASYLTDRTFRVQNGRCLSNAHILTAGVPQGSVLSPTLYCAYVRDIPVHPKCKLTLYADDTVIYTKHINIQFACLQMQEALNIITQWSTKWRLKINGSKSQAVVFTRRFPRQVQPLTIQNENIPFVTTVKYLGVFLDKRLTFKHHVTHIREKAFQRYMLLYPFFKSYTSLNVKTMLYKVLIRSYMTFCCEIWAQANARHLQRLDGLQRAICRTITGADYLIRNSQLYDDLDILHFSTYIKTLRTKFLTTLHNHPNPLISRSIPIPVT